MSQDVLIIDSDREQEYGLLCSARSDTLEDLCMAEINVEALNKKVEVIDARLSDLAAELGFPAGAWTSKIKNR